MYNIEAFMLCILNQNTNIQKQKTSSITVSQTSYCTESDKNYLTSIFVFTITSEAVPKFSGHRHAPLSGEESKYNTVRQAQEHSLW